MGQYTKPWKSIDDQASKLADRGVDIEPRDHTFAVLGAVGYYRLTGYLYPFRRSESHTDSGGHREMRILNDYRPGTSIRHITQVIDFDRRLRLLVLDGVERIEVAARMRVGYVLGRRGALAHLDPANFTAAFVGPAQCDDPDDTPLPGKHEQWLERVTQRLQGSDEAFVAHFRDNYDGQMPIWALTEILELGHVSTLYRGLTDEDAQEIATAFGVPTKKLMVSWLASVNYVRNVAAHHARLFNRKLQNAPGRPKASLVPLLDHLRDESNPKPTFGVYNALAVIAYLLKSVGGYEAWCHEFATLMEDFPPSPDLSVASIGLPAQWRELELWRPGTSGAETPRESPGAADRIVP